jgi:hypothetical protein
MPTNMLKTKRSALLVMLFTFLLAQAFAGSKDKEKGRHQDPYGTAELEAAPPVNPADLAYRTIVFDQFKIPQEFQGEKNAEKHVEATTSRAISRLEGTKAFSKVERAKTPVPEEPYLLVKATLLDYRIVGKKSRFFAGGLGGTSYMAYAIRILDGKSGNLLHEFDVTTENNIMSGAWSFGGTDADIPYFLGNVLADYLILRARSDKGTQILPVEKVVPDGAVFVSPNSQLMWAAKDNHENASWDRAAQIAKDFRGGNFSDWRLPTDLELQSLYDKDKTVEFANGHKVHVSDQVLLFGYMYWSGVEKGKDAKYFDFEKGKVSSRKKDEVPSMRVLLVRNAK